MFDFCKKTHLINLLRGQIGGSHEMEDILLFSPFQLLPLFGLGPLNGFLNWHRALLGFSNSPFMFTLELLKYKETISWSQSFQRDTV